MNRNEIIETLDEAFDPWTVDRELWDELDNLDPGERINVPITVMDLIKIRDIVRTYYTE